MSHAGSYSSQGLRIPDSDARSGFGAPGSVRTTVGAAGAMSHPWPTGSFGGAKSLSRMSMRHVATVSHAGGCSSQGFGILVIDDRCGFGELGLVGS